MKSKLPLFTILSIVAFFILNKSFSQISELDAKYGFKSIKFGSEKLDIPEKKLLGGNLYTYTGEDTNLKRAFNVDFDFLVFNFGGSNGTLQGIQLSKIYSEGRIEKGDYRGSDLFLKDLFGLYDQYEKVLGKPNNIKGSGEELDVIYYWIGDKVGLELKGVMTDVKLNDDGTPYYLFNVTVAINAYEKVITSKGF